MGFLPSWAPWAELGPTASLLLSLFFSAADSLGPRVGVSGIPRGFFLIRCELQCVCSCVCVLCVQRRLATLRTRRRGVGAATAHRRRDGNGATRLRFDVQASEAPPWLGCERAQVRRAKGALGRSRTLARRRGRGEAMAGRRRRGQATAVVCSAEVGKSLPSSSRVRAHTRRTPGKAMAGPWRRNGARRVASAAAPWHASRANQ